MLISSPFVSSNINYGKDGILFCFDDTGLEEFTKNLFGAREILCEFKVRRSFRVTKGLVPGRLFWALPGAPARQLPPRNGQLPSGHKRPFSLKESVGQKTRTTGPFPAVEGKERALAVSCQEWTTCKSYGNRYSRRSAVAPLKSGNRHST